MVSGELRGRLASVSEISNAALLIFPVISVLLVSILYRDQGPWWGWWNFDPAYSYLLDGLNLANGAAQQFRDHPGIPVGRIHGAILWLFTPDMTGAERTTAVLEDPGWYLNRIHDFLIAATFVSLVFLGWGVRRLTGSLGAAMLLQAAPLFSVKSLHMACRVDAEHLMWILAGPFIVALLALARKDSFWLRVAVGAIAATAAAAKLSAACWLLPALAVCGSYQQAWTVLRTFILVLIGWFLCISHLWLETFVWFLGMVVHTGHWGMGEPGIVDSTAFLRSAVRTAQSNLTGLLLLGIGAWVTIRWLTLRRSGKVELTQGEWFPGAGRLAVGILLAIALNLVGSFKHPGERYLVPSYLLAGPLLLLLADLRFVRRWLAEQSWSRYVVVTAVLAHTVSWGLVLVHWQAFKLSEHADNLEAEPLAVSVATSRQLPLILLFTAGSPANAFHWGSKHTSDTIQNELAGRWPAHRQLDGAGIRTFDGIQYLLKEIDSAGNFVLLGTRERMHIEFLKEHLELVELYRGPISSIYLASPLPSPDEHTP